MTYNEMKQAIEWLVENERCKLLTYLSKNFNGMDWIKANLVTANRAEAISKLAYELTQYDLIVQLEVVEMMY